MTSSNGIFTYWSLLGLSPGSDADQLKKAFRKEAMRWHPDLNKNNQGAEERFKWINEAYKVLNDPIKRFEWEKAGQPPFEIKEVRNQPSLTFKEAPKATEVKAQKHENLFTVSEKLLLVLISMFSLFLVDAFIL